MKKILLKKGLVFSGCGFERTDMLIVDGKIAKISTRIHDDEAEEINLMGLYVLPGLVDVHVHLREPGFEYKDNRNRHKSCSSFRLYGYLQHAKSFPGTGYGRKRKSTIESNR